MPLIGLHFSMKPLLLCLLLLTVAACSHAQTQGRASQLPQLLTRLDKAPLQWEKWNGRAQRGDEMASVAQSVSSVTKPLAPRLERAAKNSTLSRLSRLPLVGGAAGSVQKALGLLTSIDKGFGALVEADARHNAPLRAAAQAGAQLKRTRAARDAPAVARSFGAAQKVLSGDESRVRAQRQKLLALQGALAILQPLAERNAAPNSKRLVALQEAKRRLSGAMTALDKRAAQLNGAARWLGEGAAEAGTIKP